MRVTKVAVKRSAKINVGNYENTDVSVELEAEVGTMENAYDVEKALMDMADEMLADKVDTIEMGDRRAKSKARRFGASIAG